MFILDLQCEPVRSELAVPKFYASVTLRSVGGKAIRCGNTRQIDFTLPSTFVHLEVQSLKQNLSPDYKGDFPTRV